MPVIDIPLGEWLPDAPSFKNPGCEVADNVIPTTGGYGPFFGPSATSQTVTQDVKGAVQLFTSDGTSIIVGGMDTGLFTRRTAVAETTGLASIGEGEAWDFAQFNAFVIATANANSPQYLTDIDSDDTWSALTGSPPVAKRCAKVGDFLMLGNIAGAPNRVQWSAFNSPGGSWTPSRLTQAGFADLPKEFGDVQRIVGGRYATVFQARGISRLSYVGPPQVWRSDIISQDRGAVAPFSVVTVGYFTFFLAQDGFFVTNGASVEPIGTQRVNRWFFENVNQSRIKEVHAAVDWQNESIVWGFHGTGSEAYNRLLVYSWAQQRFSTATLDFEWVVGSTLDGIDLDTLDSLDFAAAGTPIGTGQVGSSFQVALTGLDAISLSLDSEEFKAKDRRLSCFTGRAYATFTGTPLEATWETGEFQPAPGRRVFVSEAAPVMDADDWNAVITLLGRDNRGLRGASAPKACGWSGFAPVRLEGQKMALRMVKPSGRWKEAQGAQVRFEPAGYR